MNAHKILSKKVGKFLLADLFMRGLKFPPRALNHSMETAKNLEIR